jgi:hypothetical protein
VQILGSLMDQCLFIVSEGLRQQSFEERLLIPGRLCHP